MALEQMEADETEAGAAAAAAYEVPDGRDATLSVDEAAGKAIEAEARGRGRECEVTMGEASDGDYVGSESGAGGEAGASEDVAAMDEGEGGAAAMGEATVMEVDEDRETGGEGEMTSSQGSASSGASGGSATGAAEPKRSGKKKKKAGRSGNERCGLGTAERKRRARETASEAGTPT